MIIFNDTCVLRLVGITVCDESGILFKLPNQFVDKKSPLFWKKSDTFILYSFN